MEGSVFKILKATGVGLAALAAVALVSPNALGDKLNNELSDGARDFGMGTATINSSRGPYSVFLNPANIAAKDTGTHIEPVNLQLDFPTGTLQGLSQSNTGVLNVPSLGSIGTAAVKNPNTFEGGRYSLYPNVTFRNFSVGMLYEVNQGATYNPNFGQLRVLARDRFAPVAALSERLFGGILRFGFSAQYVTVGNADTQVSNPNTQNMSFSQYISSQSALSLNAGATLTLPFRYLPSFSLVARDIGNSRYTGAPMLRFGDLSTSYTQLQTYDAATSVTYLLGKRLELKIEGDYRDLLNADQASRMRHASAGTEFVINDLFKIRGGLAHGYPSAGFGIVSPKASLEFAVYSDELDDRLRADKETRYMLQYTWGIFK